MKIRSRGGVANRIAVGGKYINRVASAVDNTFSHLNPLRGGQMIWLGLSGRGLSSTWRAHWLAHHAPTTWRRRRRRRLFAKKKKRRINKEEKKQSLSLHNGDAFRRVTDESDRVSIFTSIEPHRFPSLLTIRCQSKSCTPAVCCHLLFPSVAYKRRRRSVRRGGHFSYCTSIKRERKWERHFQTNKKSDDQR